jgi:hypothetical protein
MRMIIEVAASSCKSWLNIYAEQKAVREATSAAADGKDTQLTANRGGWKVPGAVVGKLAELYALFSFSNCGMYGVSGFCIILWSVRRDKSIATIHRYP